MGTVKKVLITASYPAPYRVALFDGFRERYGWDIDVYFESNSNESRHADWFVKPENSGFRVVDNPAAKAAFSDALSRIDSYDIALTYDSLTKQSVRAIRACKKRNVPYFINCDGWIYHGDPIRGIGKRLVRPWMYRDCRGFFSSGASSTRGFLKYRADAKRIYEYGFTSLYGRDIPALSPTPAQRDGVKTALGLDRMPTVLTVGQFIKRKGIDVLLEAWGNSGCGRYARLVIIGGGPLRESYLSYVKKNQIPGVTLMDYMPKAQLARYYLASDLFVLPTREDIWGLVVNEAMAAALPVITTDACNAGLELITPGDNGYIVPVGNATELETRMRNLITNPGLCRKMGDANLQKIRAYTVENMIDAQYAAILDALGEK